MDLTILWLVPVAYFVHILEESPRFVPWAVEHFGAPETFGQFVLGNVILIYSPGVVTGGAVYVPVSLYIYSNFWTSGLLSTLNIVLSIIIGFAVMYVPTLIQMRRNGKI